MTEAIIIFNPMDEVMDEVVSHLRWEEALEVGALCPLLLEDFIDVNILEVAVRYIEAVEKETL